MKDQELETMDKEELLGVIKAQQFEIERLNNIINELEKWLNDNENLLIHYDYESKYEYIYVDNILDKLQELKGSDK